MSGEPDEILDGFNKIALDIGCTPTHFNRLANHAILVRFEERHAVADGQHHNWQHRASRGSACVATVVANLIGLQQEVPNKVQAHWADASTW